MNFGQAIEALKQGERVCRSGWNGKDMYIFYQGGYPEGKPIDENIAKATKIIEGSICKFHPEIIMKAADNSFFNWNPNALDTLSEDWKIYSHCHTSN